RAEVDGRHADRAHAVEQGLAHGGLALRHAGRLRRREPLSPRRPPPPYLPHQGRRKDVDRGRRGHAVERGRERGARRPGAAGIAVCRDGAERVRVVRRRWSLAIAAARSAGELGARPRRARHRPGRGDAWTRVLDPRRHHSAAPGRGGRRCRRGGRPLSVPPGAPPPALQHEYPISAIPGDTPREPRGPWVLPGSYTVRLTVDGMTLTQPLAVRMDPRLRPGPGALEQQFALALRLVRAVVSD